MTNEIVGGFTKAKIRKSKSGIFKIVKTKSTAYKRSQTNKIGLNYKKIKRKKNTKRTIHKKHKNNDTEIKINFHNIRSSSQIKYKGRLRRLVVQRNVQ